jgi:DNA (cytosine-5)-methyltransferase 1
VNAPREIILDSFAGGGGASTGIEMALGRSPDVAINHDADALAMHEVNHPHTLHLNSNIWQIDPDAVMPGRPIGLAWFSPDCKHHSKAKGGKPLSRNIRDLAWVVVLWAQRRRPRVILLENVEEFQDWCPLDETDRPAEGRKGETFRKWVGEFKKLGYKVEWRQLRACDYGAPTIRKRLFLAARCDGRPIVWPTPTHGNPKSEEVQSGKLQPWRTAAEIIDWTLPCHSIFLTREEGRAVGVNRPLAEATMARIAKGVQRYVIDAAEPFIISVAHGFSGGRREYPMEEPLGTVTGGGIAHGLVVPTIIQTGYGERAGQSPRVPGIDKPLGTVVAGGVKHALVETVLEPAPFVTYAQHGGANRPADAPLHTITASQKDQNAIVVPVIAGCGGRAGQSRPRSADEPLQTVTTKADSVLAAVHLTKFSENSVGHLPDEPLHTVMAGAPRHGVVAAHITKFNTGSVGSGADEPLHTITANSFIKRPGGAAPIGVVAAFLAQHNGGKCPGSRPADEPVSTVTATGAQQGVVSAHLLSLKGSDRRASDIEVPHPTVTAQGTHSAEVRAFLVKYYGNDKDGVSPAEPMHTVPTRDRFGLVMVHGEPYEIVDIGMRMLRPRELFRAQGFPDSYVIDRRPDGTKLTGTASVRMCGNSVSPVMAKALVAANYTPDEDAKPTRKKSRAKAELPTLFEAAE